MFKRHFMKFIMVKLIIKTNVKIIVKNSFSAGFMVFLSMGTVSYAATTDIIERVEPPHWWVDFEQPKLQLLLYGKNISTYDVAINYPGVTLKSIDKVTNTNYIFINLELGKSTKAGQLLLSFNNSTNSFTYPYELQERKAHSAQRKGFDSSDVMYLITPDRFANGDVNNDTLANMYEGLERSKKEGRHGGDIAGISKHLGYIKDLGFTAIWSTPLLENNMPITSYHGYAITDFYKIDPRFGSNEDYKNLSKKAQQLGMGLIMDMVVNHIGSKHWWGDDLPEADWLNFPKKYVQSNHRRIALHDPYVAKQDKDSFTDGWFWTSMPDLNQRNSNLATYLIQNSIWWIEYADLAGVRMDTYSYPDKDFMATWSKSIIDEYPQFNIVGERYINNRAMVAYYQRGKVNADGYVSYLPSVMDFPLQDAMVKGLTEAEGWDTGLIQMYKALGHDWQYANPKNLVIFSDNHDMQRIFTQLSEDVDLMKMAMAYTFTMRGIPQMFYGTEILINSPGPKDDGIIRSDFPGGWQGDTQNGFTGLGLSTEQKDMQSFIKTLLNWRKTSTVIHNGKLMHFLPEQGIYAYFRYNSSAKVMVIFNKNNKVTEVSLGRFAQMINKNSNWTNAITKESVTLNEKINLLPRSVLILEEL